MNATFMTALLAMAVAAPAEPGEAAQAPNYTRYFIHSIGDGTLVANSCLTPERFAVKTDEKTVVTKLDGTAGRPSDLKLGQWVKLYPVNSREDPDNQRIARIEVVEERAKPVDERKAATAEVVVRGTLIPVAAGPGRGGWPTYALTVSEVFKTPKDVKIGVGQKLTVKTIKELKGPVTLYLVFDKDQKLYRLQDPMGEGGFSHVDACGLLCFDVYSGYFVSNKFEPGAAESFVVITDQARFDQVFGLGFVMNDKSHRLPRGAFETMIVVAVIKRGHSFWEYEVEDVTVEQGMVQLRYATTSKATPDTTFAWVTDRAAQGWLVLNINAHDLPIDEPQQFYNEQTAGALKDYPAIGNDDRETSCFLRMYLSCFRAAQYLTERSDWDGHTLVVTGGSQGGLQSIITAGLHPKVTAVLACVPAGCDLNGPVAGRLSGWPMWYWKTQGKDEVQVRRAATYYDVVNFAPRVKCPVLIGVGLIDTVCPSPGVYAAYNQLQGPKEIVVLPFGEHGEKKGSHGPYYARFNAWSQALVEGKPAPVE